MTMSPVNFQVNILSIFLQFKGFIVTNFQAILKYHELIKDGKKAALDMNINTNEIKVRYTISKAGIEGNGSPPGILGVEWYRIV